MAEVIDMPQGAADDAPPMEMLPFRASFPRVGLPEGAHVVRLEIGREGNVSCEVIDRGESVRFGLAQADTRLVYWERI